MHVIIIQWWMIILLKTIFVCVQYHWKSITEMHIASLLWYSVFKPGSYYMYCSIRWLKSLSMDAEKSGDQHSMSGVSGPKKDEV